MSVRGSWLGGLLLAAVIVGIWQSSGPFTSRAQIQPCARVDDTVSVELESRATTSVIISLEAARSFQVGNSIEELQQLTAAQQARVLGELTGSDFEVTYKPTTVPALVGIITASGVDKLACQNDVITIGPNREGEATLTESVPLISADTVHQAGLTGAGVTVAVFDTGIDTDHPDLVSSIIGEACLTDVVPGIPCPDDPAHSNYSPGHPAEDTKNGHGTYVSGIIVSDGITPGVPKGVAPDADLYAYKVLGDLGQLLEVWVLAALDDVISNHVVNNVGEFDFINMSFSTSSGGSQLTPQECHDQNPAISVTIQVLRVVGTLSIAGSGNRADKAFIGWPACIPAVVSVGAVYDANVGTQTFPFLCTDVTTSADKVGCFSDSADWLDLLAPGCRTVTTAITGAATSPPGVCGTSMASPHAVGVAALLKQAMPGLSPLGIIDRMKSTGKWVYDDIAGRWTPRIDARVALLTNDNADDDGDGCKNGAEFGSDVALGGQRNPLDPWDFYDTNGDGVIDLFADILGVINRNGTFPGGPPNPDSGLFYDASYDRGPQPQGAPYWKMTAPDGVIDLFTDVLGVINQQGHNCN